MKCKNDETLAKSSSESTPGSYVRMKRLLGIPEGIAIIIGIILGSGIFVSPQEIIQKVGSFNYTIFVWILSGFIALFGAISYLELGTMIPKSGGDYSYLYETFGDMVAFLFMWDAVIIFFPTTNAIMALTFSQYILQPFSKNMCPELREWAEQLLAVWAIAFMSFLSCWSMQITTRLQKAFLIVKIMSISTLIVSGFCWMISHSGGRYRKFDVNANATSKLTDVVNAVYTGIYSFSGWSALNFMIEELYNPYKNLPRAIYISLSSITIIYLLVNVAYFAVLSTDEIKKSAILAADFGDTVFTPNYGWIMSIMPAVASVGSLCVHIMTMSRSCFAGARCGHIPVIFSHINVDRLMPTPCLVVMGLLSIIMVFPSDIGQLIIYSIAVESLFNMICVLGLLCLRWTKPTLPRPIKVPIIIPLTYVLVSATCQGVYFWQNKKNFIIIVGISLLGIPIYFIFVYWKTKPQWFIYCTNQMTIFFQKLFYTVQEDY